MFTSIFRHQDKVDLPKAFAKSLHNGYTAVT